ncbi:MAG: tetratricopeptide repeat protein, partial [Gemmatimonadetes bacterium]|nr:tetratricopeptide repeat protein [Gemmatimonadota bacterium]
MSESDKGKLEESGRLAQNAEYLVGAGRVADALPLATQALGLLEGLGGDEAQTLSASCLNVRGGIFNLLQQFDKALSDLSKAVELDSNNATAYANRGNVYKNLKQYDNALSDFTKSIELQPNNAGFYNNRGNVYSDLNQYENALRDFTKSIELRPTDTRAYNNRGAVYSDLRQYDKALSDLNKAIELAPNDAKAYNNRGTAYRDLQEYDNALSDLNKAIELASDNNEKAGAYANRGMVHSGLEQYDNALSDLNKAIELAPKEPIHYHNRALAIAQKAYSEQLNPAEIEKTFRMRERAYRKRLGAVEKTIKIRRGWLLGFLCVGGAIILAVVVGALRTYFLSAGGESGMGFPYILVWASAVLTVLLSGLSYPFINALREAQRDKSRLE